MVLRQLSLIILLLPEMVRQCTPVWTFCLYRNIFECWAFATHPEDSGSLQCNRKDKERLHHRTAGSVGTQHIVIPYLSILLLIM